MPDRRSSAPLQTDPILDRLGKTGRARDVRCPSCGVLHATSVRWHMRCPECGHTWIDRSSRSPIDETRDRLPSALVAILGITTVIGVLVFFGAFVAWLFAEVAETRGWDRTYGLAVFFVLCALSLPLLALAFRRS